jgi:hypothetical protein
VFILGSDGNIREFFLLNSLLVKSLGHFCEFGGMREVPLSNLVQL